MTHPARQLTVDLDGRTTTMSWAEESTLLDAMLDGGVDAPHSCTQGQCGACECVVEAAPGTDAAEVEQIHMDTNQLLDKASVRDGYRLACQSRYRGEGSFVISYDM